MDVTDFPPSGTFWQENSFRFIKPDEFEAFGVDPADIPLGTFAALKHPSYLPSRFGGNAYGFGLFEVQDRLNQKNINLLQTISFEDPGDIQKRYKDINEIYKKIGLLIRFSSHGVPYYLVPAHLLSSTLTHIRSKVDEVTKIVGFHRKKYFKEYHDIGLVTHPDDLFTQELSLRFKEHNFVVLDSLQKLRDLKKTLDLVILSRDLYEIILMKKFSPISKKMLSKTRLDQYALYILWKLYSLLKPNGEIFVIANRYTPKTNGTANLIFKSEQEEKNFTLFTHLFKTKKKYVTKGQPLQVNIFDFQKYLSGLYVEQEVVGKLLGENRLEDMSIEQINKLPYLNLELTDFTSLSNQEKNWSRLLSIFFEKIFLKPLIPEAIKNEWEKRFSCTDYSPNYMLIYLGQKKRLEISVPELMREVMESRLVGCPPNLLADYRNSFGYLKRTLYVLKRLKDQKKKGLQDIIMDRLTQPLENKNRRFRALNDVLKLMAKVDKLEKINGYLNPDKIEGSKTKVLENLEALILFGFNINELKEIVCIVLGHTTFGRIISGKMNEKTLKPVSDLSRTYDPQQAINLLRFCRLMTVAETEGARGYQLTRQQLAELIDLYESTVRVVINRELDWDILLDEKISSMGGIHNKVIRKILKMMGHFEFLNNWSELRHKGQMEKESLADYDDQKLSRIENVIRLEKIIEQFEGKFLKTDPLQLPRFYRRVLEIEFHGTGHIFERLNSDLVFKLLYITANLSQGGIINFNPILAEVEPSEIDNRIRRVGQEAGVINVNYMNLPILRQFRRQLFQNKSSFIIGTGFQVKVEPDTQNLEIAYMDMDNLLEQMETLLIKLEGCPVSEISVEDMVRLETLFSSLESFYQSHIRLLNQTEFNMKLPERQNRWFQKVRNQRRLIKSNFQAVFFQPESIYTDLDLLYRNAPSLLNFILPEFMALHDIIPSWHLYMISPVAHYIINATRKFQALLKHDRDSFQDVNFMHRLAQREFGPLATGTVGVSEQQIETLEAAVDHLSRNRPLFQALILSFIFQDIGRVPLLREKYDRDINVANLAHTGAFFIEKEGIAERYGLEQKGKDFLTFLVKNHSLLHHIVRGEYSISALQDAIDPRGWDLFEAFFVLSFIMISSIREDLILEDLAIQLFQLRSISKKILDRETTLKDQLDEYYFIRGKNYYALESHRIEDLPVGVFPSDDLKARESEDPETLKNIQAGKMIYALERLFRMRGIRYVEYLDIVNLMLKVPLKFIYKKRRFSSIGFSTFEKEVFEALRIYNALQNLAEKTRRFILNQFVDDKVRIYGYENVSGYLSYENHIKLLLIGLLGINRYKHAGTPVCLSFLGMSEKIDKRYEAVNDYLNMLSTDKLGEDKTRLNQLFKSKRGLLLTKESFPDVFSIDFRDRINITQKISYISATNDVDQLKNYFHYSLRSLRKHPFFTDDYEALLEDAFERRMKEITDIMVEQAKKQMDLMQDFKELNNLVSDLIEQSLEIGLSSEQKHRIHDLHELRKDSLKRDKLSEIEKMLEMIHDMNELNDYWESIKWYLQSGRRFFGKEFETLIAQKFDAVRKRVDSK